MRTLSGLVSGSVVLLVAVLSGTALVPALLGVAWFSVVLWTAAATLGLLRRAADPQSGQVLSALVLPAALSANGLVPALTPSLVALQTLLYVSSHGIVRAATRRPREVAVSVALLGGDDVAAALREDGRAGRRGRTRTEVALHLRPDVEVDVLCAQLRNLHAAGAISTVLLGPAQERDTSLVAALRALTVEGLDVVPLSAWCERHLRRVPLACADAAALVRSQRLPSRLRRLGSRSATLAVALPLALLVSLVLPLIALAIVLDSPGPVLFRQRRVGLGGRHFDIVKFRTMYQDAEAHGAQFATRGDSRITRVGRLLRRTRLDELPQVWNMLHGDMTLIGPRPERPEFVQQYRQTLPCYDVRHSVRPGLTGWAQVVEGYTVDVDGTARKLECDLFYLKHRSRRLDALILARTCGSVLRMSGQ